MVGNRVSVEKEIIRFTGSGFSQRDIMDSQCCYRIQYDDKKRRATMHINRKSGEQVEVDWAGNPATIIDPDTGEIIKAYIFFGVMTFEKTNKSNWFFQGDQL